MKLVPQISLGFNGQCEAAFRFYEQALGGSITYMVTYEKAPWVHGAPPDFADKVAHATLKIGDGAILGADVLPEWYEKPQGFEILLQMNDSAEADRVFTALATNGVVTMQLQQAGWGARFGVVVDQFGVRWSINCEQTPSGV